MRRVPARRASKRLGQNFLVDRGAVSRILRLLPDAGDVPVIEIGPGRGALTRPLIERGYRVVAIELDRSLASRLRAQHDDASLELIEDDILKVDLPQLMARLDPRSTGLDVVGNLPYSVSKAIAAKLVAERRAVRFAALMFQREVAERITATPGSRSYAPISVLAQEVFRIERVFDLRPTAFRPAPKVFSSVTRWTRREPDSLDASAEHRLRACLAACFAQRRRTLRNNLRAALADDERVRELLRVCGIDGGLRAEQLEASQFRDLARRWPEAGAGGLAGSSAGDAPPL
ncbi:MAG: ribosomal RNA small subunit methyltransferase A [Planctomycetes bacterium]|nr:ribosomal RNA small subunit methyltransferase A [Planctomycetota bacterium]